MSTQNIIHKIAEKNIIFRLYKHYVIDSVLIIKNHGFKELLRRRGKKFFLVIIAYYAVRDSVVYIIIPFCIAKGLF
jgi:hypothetical protein